MLGHPDEVPEEFAEDPNLMRESYRWVKGKTKQDTNMSVYLDNNSKDTKLMAFFIGSLGSRSRLNGRYNLDDDVGRLVGYLAPEVLGVINEYDI